MSEHCMVLVTFAQQASAGDAVHEALESLIDTVLALRLASCAQCSPVHSHYIWKGERCRKDEVLVTFMSRWSLYEALEKCIEDAHPYETPQIVALPIAKGLPRYLAWIDDITRIPSS